MMIIDNISEFLSKDEVIDYFAKFPPDFKFNILYVINLKRKIEKAARISIVSDGISYTITNSLNIIEFNDITIDFNHYSTDSFCISVENNPHKLHYECGIFRFCIENSNYHISEHILNSVLKTISEGLHHFV